MGAGSGSNTFQDMSGCVVGLDRSLLRLYSQYAYDGTEYIALNVDLSSDTAADKGVRITANRNLVQNPNVEGWKLCLEGLCESWLHLFLAKGKETLLRAGTRAGTPQEGICGLGQLPRRGGGIWGRVRMCLLLAEKRVLRCPYSVTPRGPSLL